MSTIDTSILEQLNDLIGGDRTALADLIESFIDEGGQIVGAMDQAAQDNDLEALRRGAHSLKSSAQDFGAAELSEKSATLESQCREAMPADAQAQVQTIATNFEEARNGLQAYLASAPGA